MTVEIYSDPISYYDKNALELVGRYESVSFMDVHGELIPFLPKPGSRVLDVGAGSGRDAAWLAGHGYQVTAVEPSTGLRREGQKIHQDSNLNWVNDALPDLKNIVDLNIRYSLILLSAVLMFLPPDKQPKALSTLVSLLEPEGVLEITARLGPSEPERGLYCVEEDCLRDMIIAAGFTRIISWKKNSDSLGRSDIHWLSIVLKH